MSTKKYTKDELDALVSEIEVKFDAHLAKAEADAPADLTKKEEDIKKCGDISMSKDEDEKKDEDKKDEDKKEDKKEDKQDDAPAANFEKSEYSDEDKEQLKKLYTGMSKSEQGTHFEALKSVMIPAAGEQPMQKSETANEGLAKAEETIAALKKSNEELQASVASLVEAANKRFTKPAPPKGKAVTNLAALEKSEKTEQKAEISREDAKKILSKKAQGNLNKSDRDLINAFCFNQVGLDKIQHLLTT